MAKDSMTPERRAQAIEFLRSFTDDVLREAAAELEAMPCAHEAFQGACVRCGADLPAESPEMAALRADLARARERTERLTRDAEACCRTRRGMCSHGNV